VPLLELRGMIGHGRFLAALLVVNFVVVPPLAWLLARFLPPDPVILLGVYLVMLAPCTDWFVSFTLLGKGDARLAIAATLVLLLSQMLLLPAWLWLFPGGELAGVMLAGKFLEGFLGLIVLPLVLVAICGNDSAMPPARGRSSPAEPSDADPAHGRHQTSAGARRGKRGGRVSHRGRNRRKLDRAGDAERNRPVAGTNSFARVWSEAPVRSGHFGAH
jgi:hypothetical protein